MNSSYSKFAETDCRPGAGRSHSVCGIGSPLTVLSVQQTSELEEF